MSVSALAVGPSAASAQTVQCGQVITTDTTLQNDLVDCPGDGLVIGAAGITIDLNGHTIAGRFTVPCDPACAHQDGLDNSAGHDRVSVEDGVIRDFEVGLRLDGADRNEVTGLDVVVGIPGTGIYLSRSNHNRIVDVKIRRGDAIVLSASDFNTVADSAVNAAAGAHAGAGVRLTDGSDRNRVTRNALDANGEGFVIADSDRNLVEANETNGKLGSVLERADRNVIVDNELDAGPGPALVATQSNMNAILGNAVSTDGPNWAVRLAGDRNLVSGNSVLEAYHGGIEIVGVRNEVRSNTVAANAGIVGDGIAVPAAATRTVVEGNLAAGAGDDGVDIDAPGTLVRQNTANNNGDLGIEAVEGVIDGGGNRAAGNGNPLQCLGVTC